MDLELATLFELSEPVTRQTGEMTRLDNCFESCDYGIESAFSKRDEDIVEISIVGNRVVRKYR